MHWGVEYAKFLPKYHGEQVIVQLTPYVDVIIGSHPHVVQDHFYNDGALVVQSVGNMLFPLHGSVMNVCYFLCSYFLCVSLFDCVFFGLIFFKFE